MTTATFQPMLTPWFLMPGEPPSVRDWLKDARRDQTQEDIEEATARFGPESRVTQSYLSKIERGAKPLSALGAARMDALRRVLGISAEMWLTRTGYEIVTRENAHNRVSPDVVAAGDADERDFQANAPRLITVTYYSSGAGPTLRDQDAEGTAVIPDTHFLERHPSGRYVRIEGSCMEPQFPQGWLVAVIPDPALADVRSPVLVWFAGNGRKVKYLLQSREDGDHYLLQTNPPVGEAHVIQAPVGSRILGVIVEVVPPIQPGHAPRLSTRELTDFVASEQPELLDDLDL